MTPPHLRLAHGPAHERVIYITYGAPGILRTQAACVIGEWAWHRMEHAVSDDGDHVCTHVPTGYAVRSWLSPRHAELLARALDAVGPYSIARRADARPTMTEDDRDIIVGTCRAVEGVMR